jgi:hypothetical protein
VDLRDLQITPQAAVVQVVVEVMLAAAAEVEVIVMMDLLLAERAGLVDQVVLQE